MSETVEAFQKEIAQYREDIRRFQEEVASEAGVCAEERQVGGSHYMEMGVQPWRVVDSWRTLERIGFYRGNALKYLMRFGAKGVPPLEDAEKAQHYLDKLIEVLTDAQAELSPQD